LTLVPIVLRFRGPKPNQRHTRTSIIIQQGFVKLILNTLVTWLGAPFIEAFFKATCVWYVSWNSVVNNSSRCSRFKNWSGIPETTRCRGYVCFMSKGAFVMKSQVASRWLDRAITMEKPSNRVPQGSEQCSSVLSCSCCWLQWHYCDFPAPRLLCNTP
jgi:hypothetical protein